MKAKIQLVSLAVAGMSGMGANLASAIPAANQQGDYPVPAARQRGNRQVNWVVVDSDSQGLNCRMAQRFRSVSVDGIDASAELFERNKHNVSQWLLLTVFRGERLQAVTGNNANKITIADPGGKPWLPIFTGKGNCFVRANSRFIKPIENPTIAVLNKMRYTPLASDAHGGLCPRRPMPYAREST
ncbi:hypothetical protein Q5692_33900 [Microcoleus sp. C2C3]